MRWLSLAGLALGATACSKVIFGSGDLFIWNGTDGRVDIVVDGRTSATLDIPAHRGERVEDATAGPYRIFERTAGGQRVYTLDLKNDGSSLVNIGAASCFARSDISGMYESGKERVRLLQSYDKSEVLAFDLLIPVMPGEPLPVARPKVTVAFQRLSDVPCELLRNEAGMAEYVRRSK